MACDYEYVTSAERLGAIAQEIHTSPVIGLDIETNGEDNFDPRRARIRLVQINTGRNIYVIDLFHTGTLGSIVDVLHNPHQIRGPGHPIVIAQNMKMEQKFLLHHHGIEMWPIFDTFASSALIHNGRNKSHKLEMLYLRDLGESQESPPMGGSDWGASVLSKTQLDYAAEDVYRLLRLRDVHKERLRQLGLFRVAGIEFNSVLPVVSMELAGLKLDTDKWLALSRTNKLKLEALRDELMVSLPHPTGQFGLFADLGSPWNLDSPDQMLKSLWANGVDEDRLPDTKHLTLALLAAEYPVIQRVLNYREISKRLSSFGPEYLKWLNPITQRIHTNFYSFTGAGRYACLVAGSLVKTRRGKVAIEKLRPGDEVWTHRGRWRRVKAFLRKGVREVYRVRLSNGETLVCTGTHRLLSSKGAWLHVEDMIDECVEELDGESGSCARQLSSGDSFWTSDVALYAGEGQSFVTVEKVDPCGSAEVYDIAVDEDESYECCGVFSHNSSKPNLQQIPRTADYRSCFVPEQGWAFEAADYSQIELRVMATLSGDPVLRAIYVNGEDAHIRTASIVKDIPMSAVTSTDRTQAKPVNFGLLYGMRAKMFVKYAFGNYGVAFTQAEAEHFRRKFFEGYKGIEEYHQRTIKEVMPLRMTRNLSGRLRYIEGEKEYNAFFNTPCQGSAADGMKNALAKVYRRLKKFGDDVKMVHMVHDEITTEVRDDPDLRREVRKELTEGMEEGMSEIVPDIPVVADSASGYSWAECH